MQANALITKEIGTKGLSFFSLLKLIWLGFLFFFGPIIFILGITSLFGLETIYTNGKAVTGVEGFLISLVFIIILPLIFALVNAVIIHIGIWVYTRFGRLSVTLKTGQKKYTNVLE